jgi:hypothetical protein
MSHFLDPYPYGQVGLNDLLDFVNHWMDGMFTGPIGEGAWFVRGNMDGLPNTDWGVFRKELTPEQHNEALASTWILSVRMVVTEPTINRSGGIWSGFSTGTTRLGLNFLRGQDGIQKVECPIMGNPETESFVFTDNQLIQLIGQGSRAALFIDGILKLTGYIGDSEPEAFVVEWGDRSGYTTGRGDFNLVSFRIGSNEVIRHLGNTDPVSEGWIWYSVPESTTENGPVNPILSGLGM